MILEGNFTIPASQQQVWEAIWDVKQLASWVPGCVAAEKVNEDTYTARLEQQIGMFKAAFDLQLKIVASDPPNRISLRGEGQDHRMASNLQVLSEIDLVPHGVKSTTLRYRHDLSIFGRLGALGYPLIQRKAREAEVEFAKRAARSLAHV